MANEEKVKTISEQLENINDISDFFLEATFSDITLIVDDKHFPAHKIILATRSKYFKSMLCSSPKQNVFTIANVPSKPFKQVLEYIYTGSISIEPSSEDLILDVLKLARHCALDALEKTISEKMMSILNLSNVWSILNKANFYEFTNLIEICHTYIDNHILEVSQTDFFTVLTEKSMVGLLERDGLPLSEIEVFKIVAKWCKVNKNPGKSVIQCLRLTCLTRNEILSVVRPSQLIESDTLLSVLATIEDGSAVRRERRKVLTKNNAPKHRGRLIKDENIATKRLGARVISGFNTDRVLTDAKPVNRKMMLQQVKSLQTVASNYAYHFFYQNTGITVDLGTLSNFNHIALQLDNEQNSFYRYYVELSVDGQAWYKVIDYSKYDCRSYQKLYFPEKVARYIRIVGTYSSGNTIFELVNLQVYFKEAIPEVRNHLICPVENVATEDLGACVLEGQNTGYLLKNNNVDYRNHNKSPFAFHNIPGGSLKIQLGQPYIISRISLNLRNFYGQINGYYIETSVNNNDWEKVINCNSSFSDQQNVSFIERPAVYIRIVGTSLTVGRRGSSIFYCSNFQCWAGTNKPVVKNSILETYTDEKLFDYFLSDTSYVDKDSFSSF